MIYLTLTRGGYILSEDRMDEYGLVLGPFNNHADAWSFLDKNASKFRSEMN
jgi:hypothetical protein